MKFVHAFSFCYINKPFLNFFVFLFYIHNKKNMKLILAITTLLLTVSVVTAAGTYRCLALGDECHDLLPCCPGYKCSPITKECVKK
jgi:hypothetical protein